MVSVRPRRSRTLGRVTETEQQQGHADPVTVVVSRRVRPGDVEQFERWADDAIEVARRRPGFLGASVLHPGRDDGDHHLVYRFDSPHTLAAWEDSPERAVLLDRLAPLVLADRAQKVTGLETWFELPNRPGLPAPPRWKQALLTVVAVLPLQLLFAGFVAPHLHHLVVRSLALTLALVGLMTWVVMPWLTTRVRHWLYPRQS